MRKTRPMQVPENVWAELKRRAAAEGKPMSQILSELIEQAPSPVSSDELSRECVFCGVEVPLGRRICDKCFYDPDIVRPQVMGALYYIWALQMHDLDPAIPTDFESFVRSAVREWAMEYRVSDEEWNTWTEWIIWRRKLKQGMASIDDPEWRKFCIRTMEDGHTGSLSSWRTLIYMFGQKVKRR